jgi:hypothetical protein
MMHTLLVYLQSTTPEQSPVVAGLLLQLDLLVSTAEHFEHFFSQFTE